MKTACLVLCAFLCLHPFVAGADPAASLPPSPTKYFNDYTGSVDATYAAEKNQRLERFERETSNQFVLAVFRQLPAGTSAETYCLQTFNAWKIGQKGVNNGVVLFVFLESHKLRLEVGRGLEGTLPDAKAQEICEGIARCFKRGDFPAGYDAGINGVIGLLQTQSSPPAAPATSPLAEARKGFHTALQP